MKTAISAALHEAASRGDHKTITALLADGADLHARDDDGWTPLHIAAWEGHREVITALLDARADLHARNNNGWTSLHVAASEGHREAIAALLDACADLHGWPPGSPLSRDSIFRRRRPTRTRAI